MNCQRRGSERLSPLQGIALLSPVRPSAKAFSVVLLSLACLSPTHGQDEPADEAPIALQGRIMDDTGAPVTDARVRLMPRRAPRSRVNAPTDEEGRYQLREGGLTGDYLVEVQSQRWVGLSYRDGKTVQLKAGQPASLDITLRRACRVRVRTVDESGEPVRRVTIYVKSFGSDRPTSRTRQRTDDDGWATLQLPPSKTKYLIGTMHDDFAFANATVTVEDPEQFAVRKIVLSHGKVVEGTVICSDGQPPAGWRILAMPKWWGFGVSPRGDVIGPQGTFTLPRVGPGKYRVTISIPSGENGSSPRTVLDDVELADMEQPLDLKFDHPSPSSMVYMNGKIDYVGEAPADGFWIFANSEDSSTHSSMYVRDGRTDFQIGPVPKGIYTLRIQSVGIESEPVKATAPADNVRLKVVVRGKPKLRGTVVDAKTGEPLTKFRIRIHKLRTLSGPNYVQDPEWQEVSNESGEFLAEVNGPGIYQVIAAGPGYAQSRTEPINTNENGEKPHEIRMGRGGSLTGIVVDQDGNPVDGATVLPLSKAAGAMQGLTHRFTTSEGGVRTVDGKFVIENLELGKESLKVTHPDFCPTVVKEVAVEEAVSAEPVRITMRVGGTVKGHVYDSQGRPEADVTLFFQDETGYGGSRHQEAGRLATVVTDESGYYEALHLTPGLCYIQRADEWESFGVLRHAVLAENATTHTVNFGGPHSVSGRLLLNNEPLAQVRVLLSGENAHFGIYRSQVQTNDRGEFSFPVSTPGDRTLYYRLPGRRSDWGRIRDVHISATGVELGELHHRTGSVTIRLEPAEADGFRFSLHEYDPVWTHGRNLGTATRQAPQDPLVIGQVPVGKYEVVGSPPYDRVSRTSLGFQLRQVVEVTPESMNPVIKLKVPEGTASLNGKVTQVEGRKGGTFRISSPDGALVRQVMIQEDGTYQVDRVPRGEFQVLAGSTRDARVLHEFKIRDGEQRELDVNLTDTLGEVGFLDVGVYTADGIPLPCQVQLEREGETIPARTRQRGRVSFMNARGKYTLVAQHSGFETLRKEVELQPVGADGRPADGYRLDVRLQPAE